MRSTDSNVLRTFTAFSELTAKDQAIVSQIVPQVPDLFKSLHRGDYTLLGPILQVNVSLEEERQFWPAQWQAWARDMGEFRGTEVIGHRNNGEDLLTYVHMQFARASLPIAVVHRPNSKIYINTVSTVFPERTALLGRRDGSFLAYNPTLGSGVIVRLESRSRELSVDAKCFGYKDCRQ